MGTRRSHFCANTAFLRANWVRTAARRGTIWMTGGHACERGGGGSGSEGMERCAVGWPWTTPVVELREGSHLLSKFATTFPGAQLWFLGWNGGLVYAKSLLNRFPHYFTAF